MSSQVVVSNCSIRDSLELLRGSLRPPVSREVVWRWRVNHSMLGIKKQWNCDRERRMCREQGTRLCYLNVRGENGPMTVIVAARNRMDCLKRKARPPSQAHCRKTSSRRPEAAASQVAGQAEVGLARPVAGHRTWGTQGTTVLCRCRSNLQNPVDLYDPNSCYGTVSSCTQA